MIILAFVKELCGGVAEVGDPKIMFVKNSSSSAFELDLELWRAPVGSVNSYSIHSMCNIFVSSMEWAISIRIH